jgi:hypothetical protein
VKVIYYIIISILLLIASATLLAKDKSPKIPDKKVLVINSETKEVYGEYTFSKFKAMADAAGILLDQKEAEENQRIFINMTDNPWIMTNGKYKTVVKIIWTDDTGKVIKEINESVTLALDLKDLTISGALWNDIERYYTATAKWGFPISVAVIIIMIALGL